MWLKMYIGTMFIAKSLIDFTEMDTVEERIKHVEKIALGLYWDSYQIVQTVNKDPVLYIDEVSSRMNDSLFENELENMTEGEIKMHLRLKDLEKI